ncbi:YcxB family protein [Micromonospora parva]|uniref:YcxB family protein n=1 Tax=Micromonospora parva TaxID=1464048 RepID=UPI0037A40297
MPSENVTAHPVQLHYTLTSDDLLDGFAAQNRSIPRPWYLRWLSSLLTVGLLAVVFVSSAVSGNVAAGTAVIGAVFVFVVVVPVVVGFSLLLRRLFGGSRWIYRLHVRQIMRGNPALSQPMQATVTDTGVHLSSAAGQSTTSWAQHPLHVETDRSFVLLASERRGGAVLVLPKRGLDAAGLAPLRSLLSAHSRRLS